MPLRNVQCPACHGSLEWVAGQETVRCAFCGTVVVWDRGDQVGAPVHCELAATFLQAGDLNAAATHLERALELAPDNALAWTLQALTAVLRHDFAAAATYAQRAASDPATITARLATLLPNPRPLFLQAALESGPHWEWGAALLETLLSRDAQADTVTQVIGARAVADLHAARHAVLRGEPEVALGTLQRLFGETLEWRQLARLWHDVPPSAEGYAALVYRAALARDFAHAVEYLERMLELCPAPQDPARVGDALILALTTGGWEQWGMALTGVQQAAQLAGADPAVVAATALHLAAIARDRWVSEVPAEFLEVAYRVDPRSLPQVSGDATHGYIGWALHLGRGAVAVAPTDLAHTRLEPAMTCLERALKLDPPARRRVAAAYMTLAPAAQQVKDSELRRRCLRRALKLVLLWDGRSRPGWP